MLNFRSVLMPGGEPISTNAQQRDRLKSILQTEQLHFGGIAIDSDEGRKVLNAFVGAKIINQEQLDAINEQT